MYPFASAITSATNKGRSSLNYCQSSVFDCPYLLCNDIVTSDFFKKSFYYCCYYFLEILLNDLELVFLEFKHLQSTKNKSVFFLPVQLLLIVS